MMTFDIHSDGLGQALLGLHIIGGNIGESIVLELPQGGWGVVDCYSGKMRDKATNLTYNFLRQRGVSELEFLALTHPHADHYRGLLDLLENFSVHQFWRFGGLSSKELPHLIAGLREDAQQRGSSRQKGETAYLDDIFRRVNNLRHTQNVAVAAMQDIKPLYPRPHGRQVTDGEAQISSIAPLTNTVEEYQEDLARCFDENNQLRHPLPQLNQNTISAALRIVYGETTIILGSDVTSESWEEVTKSANVDNRWLSCQAVKVSHHGSPTGHCDGLWALLCANGSTEAIITPFQRHRLPTQETYRHIRKHTERMSTTCIPAITFSTDANHEFQSGTDLPTQLALGAVFTEFRTVRNYEGGICSLWFDNTGQLFKEEFLGAAGRL